MLIEEYKRSLKMPEAEEVFDLIFYRPIGFVVVKAIYRLPITPNQVTVLSLVTGLLAAWYFSIATTQALMLAALWYAFANILDCSDGQLARLQGSGSLLGRVVDGVVDYVSSIAIFLGVGFGLAIQGQPMWWVVVLGGVSSALHAIMFDHYQSEFISTVRSEQNFTDREQEQFAEEIRRMQMEHRDGMKVFFLRMYLRYLALQRRASTKSEMMRFDSGKYREKNLYMIRMWSFLGPTTNRTALIVSALFGKVDAFLWIVGTLGNAWLVVCYIRQRQIHRALELASA